MPKLMIAVLCAACAVAALPVAAASAASAAASSARGAELLKKGSRGAAVRALQRRLGVARDGVFGSATRRALMRFQRRHGLAVDGVAGPATLGALGLGVGREARATPAAILRRLALCESGGNPRAVSPGGRYRGKYQFSVATWTRLGGAGDPAQAPEAVQDRIAARLYAAEGLTPWPACARGLGAA